MIDFVIYGDTDSLYIDINKFILSNLDNKNIWLSLSSEKKIDYIKKIAQCIENYVNDKIQNFVQKEIYNSIEEDFKITYEQEKIAKTGLFIKKKKYATYTVIEDGLPVDKTSITGLEIIRSDTPLIFKEGLRKILDMILKNQTDDEIVKISKKYINDAKKMDPIELSSNISINNMSEYILPDNSYKKGTPWHVKGAANYKKVLDVLNITNKYPKIEEGVKAKIIYVKNNPYGVESIAYQKWPIEFSKFGIIPDKDKMIDKFFIKKINYLLSPMGKEDIITKKNENLSLFF